MSHKLKCSLDILDDIVDFTLRSCMTLGAKLGEYNKFDPEILPWIQGHLISIGSPKTLYPPSSQRKVKRIFLRPRLRSLRWRVI